MPIIVFLAIIINTLTAKGDTLSYPDSKPGKTVDTLHDIKIPDPYRWLEDLNSEQTSAWVKAQNSLTDSYLDTIPGRKALENHLTKLWNVERLGVPSFEGGYYFFSKLTVFKISLFCIQPSRSTWNQRYY